MAPLQPDWRDEAAQWLAGGSAIGRRKVKGNINIELAVDMLEMAQHFDHVILFSGDGDLRRLIVTMQRKGLRVSVVSTLKSSPPEGAGFGLAGHVAEPIPRPS